MSDPPDDPTGDGLPTRPFRALIACLGSGLVAADRVGEAAYEALRSDPLPPSTRLLYLGVAGIDLVDELAGEDLLVLVDALQLGAAPGTVHLVDLPGPPDDSPAGDAHALGVREALTLCGELFPERLPRQVLVAGIEVTLSPSIGVLPGEIAAALPRLVAAIRDLLR